MPMVCITFHKHVPDYGMAASAFEEKTFEYRDAFLTTIIIPTRNLGTYEP